MVAIASLLDAPLTLGLASAITINIIVIDNDNQAS
jgi:hypothetical protein